MDLVESVVENVRAYSGNVVLLTYDIRSRRQMNGLQIIDILALISISSEIKMAVDLKWS